MSRRRLTLLLGVLAALGPLSIDLYLPAFPHIAASLGTSVSAVQLTLAAYLGGIALGQLVHGPLSDRLGRRPPLLAGLAVYAGAAAACALAPSLPVLAAARFVQGLGGCAGIVVARAVVRDHCGEGDAAGLYSSRMLVAGAAPVLAPLLGGHLLGLVGWRGIFAALALAAAALLGLVAAALPESHPPAARRARGAGETLRATAAALRNGRFVRLSLAGGATEAAMFAWITSAPSLLVERFGLRPERVGLVLGVNALGLVAASQANRWWVRRMGVRAALRGGIVAAALASAALLVAVRADAGPGAVLAAAFAAISSVGVVMPNATAAAMAATGEGAGCASATLGVLQTTCGVAASAAASALADGSARPMAAVMVACTAAAVALAAGEREPARPPDTAVMAGSR